MGRLLYHGENLNSVPNDANLVKMNDGTNVEDSIESVKNALSDIVSDAYSSTKTYSVGDLCIYNNKLWKCKVSCSGQTPTENTYWTQTKISTLLESSNDAIKYEKITVSVGTVGAGKHSTKRFTPTIPNGYEIASICDVVNSTNARCNSTLRYSDDAGYGYYLDVENMSADMSATATGYIYLTYRRS